MDGREDVKEAGNTGSQYETQNGNCEAEISSRNDEHSKTGEAE